MQMQVDLRHALYRAIVPPGGQPTAALAAAVKAST
jgi:hypothetical protein